MEDALFLAKRIFLMDFEVGAQKVEERLTYTVGRGPRTDSDSRKAPKTTISTYCATVPRDIRHTVVPEATPCVVVRTRVDRVLPRV